MPWPGVVENAFDLHQLALPPCVRDEAPRAAYHGHVARAIARLPWWNCAWARRSLARRWWCRRSRSCAGRVEANALPIGFHARTQKEIVNLGGIGMRRSGISVAGRLWRLHSEPFGPGARATVYPTPGGASPPANVPRGICGVPASGRCGIRRTVFGMTCAWARECATHPGVSLRSTPRLPAGTPTGVPGIDRLGPVCTRIPEGCKRVAGGGAKRHRRKRSAIANRGRWVDVRQRFAWTSMGRPQTYSRPRTRSRNNRATVVMPLKISRLEILETPRSRSAKMIGTSAIRIPVRWA